MRVLFFAVLALIIVGCGGPGGFDGKVSGTELKVSEALLFPAKDGSGKLVGAYVGMANVTGVCDRLKAGRAFKDTTAVLIAMTTLGTDLKATAPTPGDYPVKLPTGAGNAAIATFVKTDSKCMTTIPGGNSNGVSGLVKLSAIKLEAGGSAQGTFDITFGSQNDKTTGSFNATFCDANVFTSTNCE